MKTNFIESLFIVFLILKLTNIITWSWCVIFLLLIPNIIQMVCSLILCFCEIVVFKYIKELAERKVGKSFSEWEAEQYMNGSYFKIRSKNSYIKWRLGELERFVRTQYKKEDLFRLVNIETIKK